jgi:ATP-dependent Clp protease ATP-binding subunit ClpA
LPDKAIDLVDEAAAKLKMEITSKPVVRGLFVARPPLLHAW